MPSAQPRSGAPESQPDAPNRGLRVGLDLPLPTSLTAGSVTAVFCFGSCFHPAEAVDELEIVVGGARHRPTAWGMPRPDLLRSLRQTRAYRSGFWATVPIEAPSRAAAIDLGVAARLVSGAEAVAPLGRIEVVEPARRPSYEQLRGRADGELVAVCMTTFEPDLRLLRAQIHSLRAQTDKRWVCLISDDCSSPEGFERVRRTVDGDPRFVVSRSERRLGFYRNFERALTMAPAEAALVALCDQDDRWYPEKLEVLRDALGEAQLVYSDQRLVDAEGRVLSETLWNGRRNNHRNLASLLIANTITGAASLFRREVSELALPFPEGPGWQIHDHWLGLVAMATGKVAYVDRPLYDYVQHAGAIFGHVTEGPEPWAGGRASLMTRWRAAYFYGYVARDVQARTLLARCSSRLTPRKRRALRRFVAAPGSLSAFAWLALRPLRGALGLTETLGSEAQLAQGILWKWLITARARHMRSPRERDEASLPGLESFEQRRLRRWRARA